MEKEIVTIEKIFKKNEFLSLGFHFQGRRKKGGQSLEEIDQFLERVFSANWSSCHETIVKLKTVFREYENTNLEIDLRSSDTRILLSFDDWNLKAYHETMKRTIDDNIKIDYTEETGLSVRATNYDFSLCEGKNYHVFVHDVHSTLELIGDICKLEPITLNDNDKLLCMVYRIFFDKDPDFSEVGVISDAEMMVALLIDLGILDLDCSSIETVRSGSILHDRLKKLAPLGKIIVTDDFFNLAEEYRQEVEVVGSRIREYIDTKESEDALKKLVTTYHKKPASSVSEDEIVSQLNLPVAEIKMKLSVLKK